ncbi:UDP-glucose:glycoprotein glucosyltransferase 1 [Oopsacas minuta]|uniref:UDP-glucose:glycoprotein glucosyltransferase 1 n=1 Tax=Oopsacas minuta TaxID=111878 RepID=A0AAV7JNG0_9METZ|nr:UDP-glucose:glycoprotein glucosyltransferase 1 [Oopsacas minuta]
MYRQIAEEYIPHKLSLKSHSCQAFVVLCDTIFVCDINEIITYLPQSADTCISNTLKIGHTSEESPYVCQNISNSVIAVVYGPFGRQQTINIFEKIFSLCEIGLLGGFIYRPWYLSGNVQYPILLSGYGVELAIKSTEYHTVDDIRENHGHKIDLSQNTIMSNIEGLNFELLSSIHREFNEELLSFQNDLIEAENDLLPLKQWQISDLGLQLCQWLITKFPKMGLNALNGLVKFVQYFPVESKHLYFLDVTDELRKEILFNQRILNNFGIENGVNILSFNGKIFQNVDPFTMIPFLIDELSMLTKFQTLGVSPVDIISLIQLDFSNEEIDYGIDTRHKCVHYINDIESDIEYSSWTSSIHDLLRPTFPGVIRQVRRNLFNLILCLDPTKIESYYLLKSAEYFLRNLIPVRIGLILIPNDQLDFYKNDIALSISCFYSYLSLNRSNEYAFGWLLDISSYIYSAKTTLSIHEISAHFQLYTGANYSNHTDCTYSNNLALDFFISKGIKHFQSIYLNGIPLKINYDNLSKREFIMEDIVSSIKEQIFSQTRILQKDIYFNNLLEEMNVYDYIMSKSNIVSRLNYRILSRNWRKIDLFCYNKMQNSWFDEMATLSPCEVSQIFAKSTPYVLNPISKSQVKSLSLWLVADFSSLNGLKFLIDSLDMLMSSSTVRIGLIFNDPPSLEFNLNKILISLLFTQTEDTLLSLLLEFRNITNISDFTLEQSLRHFSKYENFNEDKYLDFALSQVLNVVTLNYFLFASEILKVPTKMRAVIVNGHILETLLSNESFVVEDFLFLERFSYINHGKILHSILKEIEFNRNLTQQNLFRNFTIESTFKSDILLYLATIVLSKQKTHRIQFPHYELRSKYSLINIQPRISSMHYSNLDIILDPLSKESQRLLPISSELYNTFNIHLRIWLCPPERISVLPINRFYIYAISSMPHFEKNGSLSRQHPQVTFTDLPKSPLLNLILDIPHVWVVEPIISDYDLDNLPESNNILAVFSLSHILLEGNCLDHSTKEPVPGLQFSLGTIYEPEKFDSLVMENLGYFQLKFFPGLWGLHLNDDSNQHYYISEQVGGNVLIMGDTILLHCDNFMGVNLQILVTKHKFNKHPILNDERGHDESNLHDSTLNSIWKSITNLLPSVQTTSDVKTFGSLEVINIFSIASGHLYERFLRIMIISVLKHTNNPIKLWILKQYLSPNFKEYLPYMANHYNFTFELVDYKWPKWLRRQEEKQREIWGYKILFLDVLFPMHLQRIIYVDADQIVRSDLLELIHLDIQDSPYAYTPFCDSRKEMDGFRFWKHGYWHNLLGKRKYHISALYVVDLKQFRKLGAGDKLRATYQALSQDPNSLANLDQDLPNSMIDSVPIFSLPQDWLWCETWCSDEDKARAKTIDMCNNPLTKEPKLVAAKRIASEWNEYDKEAREVISNYKPSVANRGNNNNSNKHTEL